MTEREWTAFWRGYSEGGALALLFWLGFVAGALAVRAEWL